MAKQSKVLGLKKDRKYSIRRASGKREANVPKGMPSAGVRGDYIPAAYGDLGTKTLRNQADKLAKKGGYNKLRESDTVAVSLDGRRVLHIATDG